MFGALALRSVERRMRRGGPVLAHGLMIAVVTLVIAGGVVIGDNEAGRFPRPPETAAGPETVTIFALRMAIAEGFWASAHAPHNTSAVTSFFINDTDG